MFDIHNHYEMVVLEVVHQGSDTPVIKNELDLRSDDIRDYSLQGQEIWCFPDVEDEEGPKLRIKIHYSYSDVQRFMSLS